MSCECGELRLHLDMSVRYVLGGVARGTERDGLRLREQGEGVQQQVQGSHALLAFYFSPCERVRAEFW